MPVNQNRYNIVSTTKATPGNTYDGLAGHLQEGIVSELHGKYFTQAYNGNLFYVTTIAAGLAVPISSTTAPTVMLWNPTGSGKNASLVKFTAAYVSGTSVATPIGLVGTNNAGGNIATGAAITAFNQSVVGTNLFNGVYGGGNTSVMKSSANGTNTVTAGTWILTMLGESALVAATAMNPYLASYDFDGTFILPPGSAIWIAGTAASGALLSQTLLWEEVPV